MNIVLSTPLYPPDIMEPAPYVKELASRLASYHQVTIVTYGRLPEQVAGVCIVAVDKRAPRLVRLLRYTYALYLAAQKSDVVYTQNGASVELPVLLVSLLLHKPLFMRLGDPVAHTRARQGGVWGMLEHAVVKRGRLIDSSPQPRPEIIPLDPYPTKALQQWEESWQKHTRELVATFHV